MTKQVRIENADVTPTGVVVRVEQKNLDGEWVATGEAQQHLDYPTQLLNGYVHAGRRLIIEVAPAGER